MRYAARFNNGFWVLFDSADHRNVDTFMEKEAAEAAAMDANTTGEWRKSNAATYEHPWRLSRNPQRLSAANEPSGFSLRDRLQGRLA